MGRGQSFLQGALILMAAAVGVKVVGALFKIPLSNLIGGEGMGYFNTAYGLFTPVYALSVSGFPVAVARLVARNGQQGRFTEIRRVLRVSIALFLLTGSLGLIVLVLGAAPFSAFVGNPGAKPALYAIAPGVFFGCLMSAYRGYYNGLQNMVPSAWSQLVEAGVKLVLGLVFCWGTLKGLAWEYREWGTVLGRQVSGQAQAQSLWIAYAAAAAILGVTVSTAAGWLYLWFRHRGKGDGITQRELSQSPPSRSREEILSELVRIAVPVCLGALITNLTTVIDLTSIMNQLGRALEMDSGTVLAQYRGLLPQGISLSGVPNYLYGAHSFAVNLFHLVPAVAASLAVSALPAVTAAWTRGDPREMGAGVESVLRVTALISFPAGVGLSVLSQPILMVLYRSRPQEAMIAAPVLQWMGIAAVFAAMGSTVNSMLQAVGKAKLPVWFLLVGAAIKWGMNLMLVPIPQINLLGAAWGTLCCYVVMFLLGTAALCRSTGIHPRWGGVLIKPAFASLCCGMAAYGSFHGISCLESCPMPFALGVAVICGGLVYVTMLLLLGGIMKDDLMMLSKGEKIVKLLEKHHCIG